MKKLLLIMLASLMAFTVSAQDFYFGNDLSYVNQMEDCGAVFKEGGTPKDVYQIFADRGSNLVRVRLWVDPTWQNDLVQPEGVNDQYSDFEDVKETIRRAKAAGMQVLLGIHYSDVWADPGRQMIPSRWLNIANDTEAMKTAVYDYTVEVLSTLESEGLMPDIVKVGNENNGGILQHTSMNANLDATGSVSTNWSRHAQLFNAAIQAVRAVGATASVNPKISLHYSGLSGLKSWYQRLINNGVTDFDLIGFSYYYSWHEGSIEALGETIRDLVNTYPQYETMVVETGYLWSDTVYYDNMTNIISTPDPEYLPVTPEKQLEYMVDFTREVKRSGGIGVIFWEPAWVSTPCRTPWGQGSGQEHVVFFDQNQNFMENGGGRWMESPYYEDLEAKKVTFKVDMSGQEVSNGVFVSGDFTGDPWVLKPMLHEGNSIYSYITYLSAETTGTFTFLNGTDWATHQEELSENCKDLEGSYRSYTIPAEDVQIFYPWGSCEGLATPSAPLTFKVDMSGQDVSNGVFVTGDFTGDPWLFMEMTDEGNNIYSYTTDMEVGSTGAFIFLKQDNWDLTSRENVPAACAPKWDTHREYVVPEEGVEYSYLWASCEEIRRSTVEVSFKVDMNGADVSNGVFITGDFTGTDWQIVAMRDEGDGIYSYTTEIEAGATGAYVFQNANNWDASSRESLPAACAPNWGTHREYVISTQPLEYAFVWASCDTISDIPVTTNIPDLIKSTRVLFPNPAKDYFMADLQEEISGIHLSVFNYAGQRVLSRDHEQTNASGMLTVNLNKLPAGLYLVKASVMGRNLMIGKLVKE